MKITLDYWDKSLLKLSDSKLFIILLLLYQQKLLLFFHATIKSSLVSSKQIFDRPYYSFK